MKKQEKEFLNIPFFKNKEIHNVIEIPQGKNNKNFKIDTDTGAYFLKILHTSKVQGIHRQTEYLTLEKVYHAGLGVKPILFEPKQNLIITEFLDKPEWTFEEIRATSALKQFGESICKIHKLSPTNQNYYITDLLDRYWDMLKNIPDVLLFKLFFESVRRKLDNYAQASDIRFCHNDLCYGHFLKDKAITFLDWELAGMNDLYSDIATFVHFHQLSDEQTHLFLQSYSSAPLNKKKLMLHQDAILLRELLWAISKLQEEQTDYFYFDYRKRCLEAILKKQNG